MATSLVHYNVFLASPSDVSEERSLVETSINELNNTVCRSLNVRLDLVKWETHSYPSVGAYSQDVINQQISDYDFFIGVMWTKIGSPTPNFSSGTIEEFNIAYEKLQNGHDIKILFYFSDKPVPPSEINPEQIIELNNFKKDLGKKGVYYYSYSLPEEFQSLVKLHIAQHLNEVNTKKKNIIENQGYSLGLASDDDVAEDEITSDFEDFGLIEYLEIFRECFTEVESAVERMGGYISELGTNISKRGDKIMSYKQMPFDTTREVKKEIERSANDILDYVKRTNVELPIFHEYYYKGMEALSNALTIQEEDDMISGEDLQSLLNTLSNNHEIFNTTIINIGGFKANVSKLPRMSASLKIAKSKIEVTLENLLLELKATQNLTEEFSKRIVSLLDK